MGDTNDRNVFTEVTLLKHEKIISIHGGEYHCIALTGILFHIFIFDEHWIINWWEIEKGILYSWGYNEYGQLGLNTTTKRELIPQQISIPESIVSIGCGENHQ